MRESTIAYLVLVGFVAGSLLLAWYVLLRDKKRVWAQLEDSDDDYIFQFGNLYVDMSRPMILDLDGLLPSVREGYVGTVISTVNPVYFCSSDPKRLGMTNAAGKHCVLLAGAIEIAVTDASDPRVQPLLVAPDSLESLYKEVP